MRRREFISALGSVAIVPLKSFSAYSQSARKIPLVGYLWHAGSAEEEQPYYGAIVEGFTQLGISMAAISSWNIAFQTRNPSFSRAWLLSL